MLPIPTDPNTKSVPPSISKSRGNLTLCLLLAVLALLLYSRAASCGFINFDDPQYVTNNPHVQAGIAWPTLQWALTTYDAGNWHPLTWLSHALDWQLFQRNPAMHHLVNASLHASNALILFLLLLSATRRTWPSWIVAALWAFHPVNVESVAWIAERKNLLSMFFFLLALYAYGKFAKKQSAGRYSLVAILFALGLMAKPQIITFPFVLLLWDYWPLRRYESTSWRWLVAEKVPLFLLSAASAFITMQAQRMGEAVRTIAEFSVSSRIENALISFVRYLGIAFWPAQLSPVYPHPENFASGWQTAAAAATFLVSVTALVLRQKQRRYLLVGWFWFLGTLVPMIGLVQVGQQAMADRYAYLPFVGLFIAAVWGLADFAESYNLSRTWPTAALIAVLIALGTITYRQLGYWRTSETLWIRALAVTKDNYTAHSNLADALAKDGRSDEAIFHFEEAGRLHAYPPDEVLALGIYEQQHGHPEDAIRQFNQASQSFVPSLRSSALANLGSAYFQVGKRDLARQSYSEALQVNPKEALALTGTGVIAYADDPDLALTLFTQAVATDPSDVRLLLLASALRARGQTAEANAAFARAQRVSRSFASAQAEANRLLGTQSKVSN
ncbi:MAG TPA: tetratricopeptide repeat protein [Terriglobales bacterium]|nr:tetratricopeptide repeat protein [Terriglobales bacterium]